MAAYDNVQLPAPPNIATAGNYADMLYKGFAGLGPAYIQGQQAQYQQRNNNLFQGGVPMTTDANGNQVPDIPAMTKQMIQAGGTQAAEKFLPMALGIQSQKTAQTALNGGGNTPVNTSPAASTSAASPASITGQTGGPRVAQTEGGDTVNSLSVTKGVDLDAFLGKYPAVRQYLKIGRAHV